MRVDVRDLACFGRPARLVWSKRRWRCRESWCPARTWTEHSEHVDAQAVITRRAGVEACRQVGENARPVSQLADELGVCWWTIMNAVVEHGTPLVDDPDRIGPVRQLGVDETSFLAATPQHATVYATGLVDLERHVVIDMVEGNCAADLRRWTINADPAWLAGIEVVATDLAESFRAGLSPRLDHTRRVADPFHVVRVANRCVDQVRRRVQNETLGHRGRKPDPLYRIRKLLLTGSERLDQRGSNRMLLGLRVGDPHDELLGAWLAKESVRDVYLADTPADAATLLDKAIAGCAADEVAEIRSLGKTLAVVACRDPRPPRHRRLQRPHRGTQPVRQEDQALRPRLPLLRQLPATRPAPRRRHHLARTPNAATDQNPLSPLNPFPQISSACRITEGQCCWSRSSICRVSSQRGSSRQQPPSIPQASTEPRTSGNSRSNTSCGWGGWGSNPRPGNYEFRALTTELPPRDCSSQSRRQCCRLQWLRGWGSNPRPID